MNGDHYRLKGVVIRRNGNGWEDQDEIDMELDDAIGYILNKYVTKTNRWARGLAKFAMLWARDIEEADKQFGFVSDNKGLPKK